MQKPLGIKKYETYRHTDIPSRVSTTNKAGFTVTLVTHEWQRALLQVSKASGQKLYAQNTHKRQISEKGTDQPTNRLTNRHNGVQSRVACD